MNQVYALTRIRTELTLTCISGLNACPEKQRYDKACPTCTTGFPLAFTMTSQLKRLERYFLTLICCLVRFFTLAGQTLNKSIKFAPLAPDAAELRRLLRR